ncbi:MAG: DUF3400 domain-containing protein [Rhodocyclaceae bacterium]|nr:DUF3400 domain-containing protein [Rhodocyclaceae bacterium]
MGKAHDPQVGAGNTAIAAIAATTVTTTTTATTATTAIAPSNPVTPAVKILTSCPSCLQGLSRYSDDANIDADYIVVEMAKGILGPNWLNDYVEKANNGGIERVLL